MQEKALLSRIKLIPFSLAFSIVFMGVLMWVRRLHNEAVSYPNLQLVFMIVIPVLIVWGIGFGNYFTKIKLQAIGVDTPLISKLQSHVTIVVVRSALIEGPALFSAIIYFLTGHFIFLIFPAILAIWIIFQNTTNERMCVELSLSREDRGTLGIS